MTGRRAVWILVPLLAAALALQLARVERLWRASRVLAGVKRITVIAAARGQLSTRLLEGNLKLLRAAEPLSPTEVGLPMARGSHYLLLERPRPAVRAYLEAAALEPRGEVYLALGRAYLRAEDRGLATAAFRTAIELDRKARRQVLRFMPSYGIPPRPPPRRPDHRDRPEEGQDE